MKKEIVTLVVYVPVTHAVSVRKALGDAGAGKFGNYGHISFSMCGTGRFTPLEGANPAIGKVGTPEEVDEDCIVTACQKDDLESIITEMKKAHPYEEVAFFVYPVLSSPF